MKRLLRRVVLVVMSLAALVVIGAIVALFAIPRETILSNGIGDFERTTGLEIQHDTTVQPVLWPIPGWRLGQITVSDPNTPGNAPPLLAAQDSLLTLAPLSLFKGTRNIGAIWLDDVRIQAPEADDLHLGLPVQTPRVAFLRLRNAEVSIGLEGSPNHQMASLGFASVDYAGPNRPMALALTGKWRGRDIDARVKLTSPNRAARGDWVFAEAALAIDGDALTYAGRLRPDLFEGIPQVAGNVTASLSDPAGAISWLMQTPPDETLINLRDVTLEGRIETLPDRLLVRSRWAGAYNGTRLSLDATLRSPEGWQQSGTGSLDAVVRAPGLFSGYLNGSFAKDQGVSGDLSLSVLDLPGVFQANILPDSYRVTDAGRGSVKGRLSATMDGVALADSTLVLGAQQHQGDAAIDLRGERPIISLGANMDTFVLDDWIDPIRQGERPLGGLLPDVDADLVFEVNAASAQYDDVSTGPFVAALVTRPDATEIEIRRLDIAGGIVTGNVRLGARSTVGKLDLTGAEIDTAALPEQMALQGLSGIIGGSIRAKIPLAGDTQDWAGIEADGTVSLFQARIDGINLRSGTSAAGARTDFVQGDVAFTIENETLTASTISLRDTLGEMSGTGTLDLVDQTLAATFSIEEEMPRSIRVGGTLTAPEIVSPDSVPDAAENATAKDAEPPSQETATQTENAENADVEPAAASLAEPETPEEGTETQASASAEPEADTGTQQDAGIARPSEPETSLIENTSSLEEGPEPVEDINPSAPEEAPLPRARR